jgi:hypothetical protein
MRSIFLLLFITLFAFNFISNAQNGGVSQPFTSLGQAQNVTADGVYYFSLSGTNFSTYVRVGGWVQVAIDFRPGIGNLPQSTALNNTVRGILSPGALSTLGSATVTRLLTSNGQLDVQNTRPGIITRIVNNQTLLAVPNDNTDNGANWTGTNTLATQFTNYGNTTAYGLHSNFFHAGNNGDGIHWIPYFNMQQIKSSAGDLPNGAYFQLLVRAPMVAVVTGPVINSHPSTTAQSVCLNAATTALSVSASSPNGSAITYQWYSNTSNSNSGGTAIGGATSASYTPPNNVVGTKYYYVICTNNQGSTTSNVSAAISVNAAPQAAANSGSVDYLVVGGGGGGGFDGAGGGGGGQVNMGSLSLSSGTYAVTIGNGGANATSYGTQAGNGGSSTLSLPTPIVSIGGGGGGSKGANGASGANGGGGGHSNFAGAAGAVGGFAGGNANGDGGGGGGGAGSAGITGGGGRNGGSGVSSSISGNTTYYGGGGGGGSYGNSGTGIGGVGGGGQGGLGNSPIATVGTPNTGGGGGGAGEAQSNPGRSGGSGVVIVRYLGSPSGTGGTITQVGGYTIHTFNSNGSFAYNGSSSAVVPNVTVCGASSVTLTSTLAAGLTLDWYDAASGGTLLSQGTSTYTTPVLASTTTYYVAVRNVSAGCVSATRTAVTATVNTTSFTSTTGASRCGTGTVTLQATTAAGTINWYAAITGGASLGTGTSYTTPSIATTTTYYAEVTNNGCTTNPRVAIVATVNSTPPTPTITQSGCGVLTLGNYGAGNALDLGVYNSSKYVTIPATLNSTINTNNITLEGWFYFTSLVPNTNYLPMLIGEAYNVDANITYCMHRQGNIIIAGFYNGGWQAASSSTFIPINTWIHIASTYDQNQIKLYFNGVLNATFNSNQTLPISGNQPWYLGKRWDHLETLGGVMDEIRIWNVARTQGQIQASMNSTVPTNSAGLRAYYKLDESTGNIASDATGNGYDGTLSNGPTWQVPSTSVLGGAQNTILWSPGGQTTNTITAATSGTYSAVVTSAGCQSASVSSSVVLGVTASSNQTICSGTSPANLILTGNAATIQWQSSTDNVNFTNIAGATSSTLSSGQMGILNATTYYRAYTTSAVCPPSNSNTITITINPLPTFTSTTGASRCGTGTVTLQAATAAGTINWYAAITGGASLGTGTSYTTPSIAATTTYYAEVTNNGCTSSPRTAVVATVNAIPTFSSTTGASICGTSTGTLQATTAAGTINWYAALTGGASLGTGTSYTTPSIATTTTYYADVTNNGCTSSPRTSVVATVNSLPQAASNSGTVIDYLVVGGGGGGGDTGGGGGGGGQVKTGSVSLLSGSFGVTIGNGGTGGTSAGTPASNGGTTTLSLPTPVVSIGGGGGGMGLSPNGSSGGNGGGGGHLNNGNPPGVGGTAAVGGFAGGNANNVIGGGGGGAGGVGGSATGSNGGIGVSSSISGSATFYGGGGGGGSWQVGTGGGQGGQGGGGSGGTALSPLATSGAANTGGGGGGSGNSQSTAVSKNGGSGIVIVRYLGSPSGTGGTITQSGGYTIHTFNSNGTFAFNNPSSAVVPNVTVCGSTSATFTGTVAAGLTLDWYNAASGGTLLSQGTLTYTTPALAATTTYYVAVRNVSTGCVSATRTAVTATVNTTSFNSTTGASRCGTGTVTLQAATAAGTINWYAALTGGASLGTGTSYTTPSIATTTTYYAEVTNNGCTTNPRVAVVATVNAIPTITSTTGASICISGTGTLQASTAAGTINWYTTLTGGTSLGSGSSYTTPSIATTTTYYADVTNNGCTSSPRTSIIATVIPSSTASSSQTVCPGLLPSPITLTNYSGTLQWQTSNDNVNFTNIGGQTSATLPANSIGIMSGTKYIRAMVTNGTCVLPSNAVTLSPTNVNVLTALTANSYVWNGQSSSDWGTLSNWYSYNGSSLVPATALPSNTHTVVIPSNSACIVSQPTISAGAIIINNLVVETGSLLTQSGGSLLLYGNYSNNGTLNSTGGLTNFYGSSSASISGSGSIQFAKMRVNKLAGASLTLQRPVTVSDSLTMVLGNIYTTSTDLLTLGINSASPGKLVYTNGTIVGPFKRFFANAAVTGVAGRFPVGTATYNRYAQFGFETTPGLDQSLTVQYISGPPMQGGSALYSGLPLMATGALIQNYSNDGYWSVIPTNNNYSAPINSVNYSISLYANNITGMQTPQICRLIKSPGSNTANQHHITWQSCGTHTAIPGNAIPTAFVITSTVAQGFSWFNIGTSNNQALPVEFSNMTTTCEDNSVQIQWTTESEHNNDYFRIEKSTTGNEWELLSYVDGVGNSTTQQTYTYFDENQRINNYYRLYQVDMDGSEELLSTLFSECENTNSNIESFPNPSHGSFSIYWKQFKSKGDVKISILNTNGQQVFQEKVAVDLGVNLFNIKADLAPGVYMIELTDVNNERKLIKHVVN